MSTKLSWKANSQKRCQKASRAVYFLKRNVSVLANLRTKLNDYVVYVIPVISYASMVWFVNRTECKEIECIQKKAVAWILSSWEVNYKNYDIELPNKLNENAINTRQNELIAIDISHTKKTDEMRIFG